MRTFLFFGCLGWIAEVIWTALYDFTSGTRPAAGDTVGRVEMTAAERWRLQGRTYLWMFPIYGGGGLLFVRVHAAVASLPWVARGALYCAGCFAIEAVAGFILKRVTGRVPWDYSYSRWSRLGGTIRLDYAPVWFAFGLILEQAQKL
jgi:hypothetical protein